MKKQIMAIFLAFSFILSSSYSVFAYSASESDQVNNNSERMQLIMNNQDKAIDGEEYERLMGQADTVQEKWEISQNIADKAISTKVTYFLSEENQLSNSNDIALRSVKLGDIRLIEKNYVTANTTYDQKSSNLLENLINVSINVGMNWAPKAAGLIYTAIGFIPGDDFYSTTEDYILRTLHDSIIYEKYVEKYVVQNGHYYWAPVVYATKKDTNAQSNLVYYKKIDGRKIRQTPENLDLGLIRTQTGKYFNNNSELLSRGRNATPDYALSYPYTDDPGVNYKHPEKLKYN